MRKAISDQTKPASLFSETAPAIVSIVRSLDQAKTDDTIKGLFIRADLFGIAPASAEELRLAILDFKQSGKFVIAHAQGFEMPSILPYSAISAADEIWLQDTTNFSVSGLSSETTFYKGAFDKFGINPQFERFYEYKNGVSPYLETGYTDAHREAVNSYLGSIKDQAMANIATDRAIAMDELESILSNAPHSAEEAKRLKMVDTLGHLETAKAYAKEKAGDKDIKFHAIEKYAIKPTLSAPVIALISGEGGIMPGKSTQDNPFSPAPQNMGSDTISKAFDDAAKDKKVKAILFRVSSPGGSAAASDQILAAVQRAQEAGKPVIISMGQYAASGGYYVAAHADHIVAMPQTITGSIGVYGGKFALEELYAKLGLNQDSISLGGEFSSAYSFDTPFSETQRAAFRQQMQDVYNDFTGHVAKGRELPLERVHEIAKGRVWTGTQALEIGLVDELGGFMTALDAAKKLAEIDGDKVRIKSFPRAKTQQELIQQALSSTAKMQADIAALREITALPEVQALLRARQDAQMGAQMKAQIGTIE